MAAGVPVVVSRVGQLAELVGDGKSGLLCPPGDAGALTDALLRLSADAALRARLAAPGLRRMVGRCWPHIRKERTLLWGAFAALFAQVIFRLLEPWPLKFILDRVIVSAPAGGDSGVPFLDTLPPLQLLLVVSLGLVGIVSFRALSEYASTVGFALIGNRVLTKVRAKTSPPASRCSSHCRCMRPEGHLSQLPRSCCSSFCSSSVGSR